MTMRHLDCADSDKAQTTAAAMYVASQDLNMCDAFEPGSKRCPSGLHHARVLSVIVASLAAGDDHHPSETSFDGAMTPR
jgi:hypothetical protein